MKALHWSGRLVAVALGLVVASNVLTPAVARAQFAATGGASVTQVLAALLGQDLTAKSLTVTASAGTGLKCNSALADCMDLGPGARNSVGTNSSGEILLGPDDGGAGTTARLSGTLRASQIILNNGSQDVAFHGFLQNSFNGYPVNLEDQDGTRLRPYPAANLKQCNDGSIDGVTEGTFFVKAAGSSSGTRLCICTSDGAATPAYAWVSVNLLSGTISTGTATSCP